MTNEPLEGKQKKYLLEFILPSESKPCHQGTCSTIHLVKGLQTEVKPPPLRPSPRSPRAGAVPFLSPRAGGAASWCGAGSALPAAGAVCAWAIAGPGEETLGSRGKTRPEGVAVRQK